MVRTNAFKSEMRSDQHPSYLINQWLHHNPTARLLDVKITPYGPESCGWFYVLITVEVPEDFKENPIPKKEKKEDD